VITIIEITPFRKKGRHDPVFALRLDNGEERLIEGETIVKFNLHGQDTLDENRLAEILSYDNQSKIIKKSVKLIALRPRSAEELRIRFLKENFLPADIRLAVEYLKERGYINDHTFAMRFAKSIISKKPVGKLFVKNELIKKGIPAPVIERVLDAVYPDEYHLAFKAAEKKIRTSRAMEKEKIKIKLTAFLNQRGFAQDIIQKVTASVIQDD